MLIHYLSESPWYLVGTVCAVGMGLLIAMKVTSDGRYLIRALAAFGLAGLLVLIEQFWVTDAERIEWIVRDIGKCIARSDGDAVLKHMDKRVTFSIRSNTLGEELDLSAFTETLKDVTFDFVHVSRVTTNAGQQSGRGSAEFKVAVGGTYRMASLGATRNFGASTEWSLGFNKQKSGEWKVQRITALSLPPYAILPMIRFKVGRVGVPPSVAPSSGFANQVGPPPPYIQSFEGRRLPGMEPPPLRRLGGSR